MEELALATGMARAGILSCLIVHGVGSSAAMGTPTTLEELTSESSLVVFGKMEAVLGVAGVRVATLSVEETWKGPETTEVAFLAENTWVCDTFGAELGERALMFLVAYEFDPEPDPMPRDPEDPILGFKEPVGFRSGVEGLGVRAPFMQIRVG